jgi:hypothetical protein
LTNGVRGVSVLRINQRLARGVTGTCGKGTTRPAASEPAAKTCET